MDTLLAAALAAQKALAETREKFSRNPRENGAALDARRERLRRLERVRDEAALAAGVTKWRLDEMLYDISSSQS